MENSAFNSVNEGVSADDQCATSQDERDVVHCDVPQRRVIAYATLLGSFQIQALAQLFCRFKGWVFKACKEGL